MLALFEIERRLHAKIGEFIEAFNQADRNVGSLTTGDFNPLVDRRHLTDLYALAHLDATVSALEQSLIDRFVQEAGLSDHVVAQVRQEGREKAETLMRDAILHGGLPDDPRLTED